MKKECRKASGGNFSLRDIYRNVAHSCFGNEEWNDDLPIGKARNFGQEFCWFAMYEAISGIHIGDSRWALCKSANSRRLPPFLLACWQKCFCVTLDKSNRTSSAQVSHRSQPRKLDFSLATLLVLSPKSHASLPTFCRKLFIIFYWKEVKNGEKDYQRNGRKRLYYP